MSFLVVVVVVAVIALTNPHLKVVWAKHTPVSMIWASGVGGYTSLNY